MYILSYSDLSDTKRAKEHTVYNMRSTQGIGIYLRENWGAYVSQAVWCAKA
jgi:hypothetical protein